MIARDPATVRDGMLALLPPGWALPRDASSRLGRLLGAPAARVAALEGDAAALLAEMDPRGALRLLAAFERVLGPDPCDAAGAATTPDRQRVAHQRWTAQAGQSRAFFIGLAAARGVAITIEERRAFKAGASRAGQRLAPRECGLVWRVRLPATRLVNFRAGASRAGHSLGAINAAGVECPITRLAPAHTQPVFAYGAP